MVCKKEAGKKLAVPPMMSPQVIVIVIFPKYVSHQRGHYFRHGHLHIEAEEEAPSQEREAAALNGDIVSESDSDYPDDYILNDTAKVALKKKIAAIRRKCRRDRAKALAEKNFLGRKRSSKLKGIVADFLNIGKTIEDYVQERSVGANAWRRTGVLTFDGNKAVQEKVTYSRIQKHLETVYKRKFGSSALCGSQSAAAISFSVQRCGQGHISSREKRVSITI